MEMQPVLFAMCVQNYHTFKGIRLNKSDYSAHHHEQEVLLAEGIEFFLMGVEDVVIDNRFDLPWVQ